MSRPLKYDYNIPKIKHLLENGCNLKQACLKLNLPYHGTYNWLKRRGINLGNYSWLKE
jgi:hypothetical protein